MYRIRTYSASLIVLLALCVNTGLGQVPNGSDSVKTVAQSSEPKLTKSPTVAILCSIIPGGGQLYNGQYWKVPIFLGAGIFFGWWAVTYHDKFTTTANTVDSLEALGMSTTNLKQFREVYRDNRDLMVACYLGTTILSMIDAYVGAHLYDFDVSDDVSAKIRFDPISRGVSLQVRF